VVRVHQDPASALALAVAASVVHGPVVAASAAAVAVVVSADRVRAAVVASADHALVGVAEVSRRADQAALRDLADATAARTSVLPRRRDV
jgi:hypothetical protein